MNVSERLVIKILIEYAQPMRLEATQDTYFLPHKLIVATGVLGVAEPVVI